MSTFEQTPADAAMSGRNAFDLTQFEPRSTNLRRRICIMKETFKRVMHLAIGHGLARQETFLLALTLRLADCLDPYGCHVSLEAQKD